MSQVTRRMKGSTKKNGLRAGQRPKLSLRHKLTSSNLPSHKRFAWRGHSVFRMCRFCNKTPTRWLCRFMSTYFKILSTKPTLIKIWKNLFLSVLSACKNLKMARKPWFLSVMKSTFSTPNVARTGWWGSQSARYVEQASSLKWKRSAILTWWIKEKSCCKHLSLKLCKES